jgi:hypothetical protein
VILRLVAAGATVDPKWFDSEKVGANPQILSALTGRMPQHG